MEYSANDRLCKYTVEFSDIFGLDFPHIDCKETLYWPAVSILQEDVEWPTKHYLCVTLKQLFNSRNQYELEPKQGAKLLFFNQTDLPNHVDAFNKIASLSPGADVVQVTVTPRRFAPLRICLKRVCRLARWILRKRKTTLSWREFWFTAPFAQLALEAKEQFEQWNLTQYNAVVFYYDFNWISDVLRQMAKAKGIKTVTLQHGVYFTKAIFPEEKNELCVRSSNADLFLAWSKMMKRMLEETGFPKENILVMGIPRYLDFARVPMSRDREKGVFGVVSSIVEYEDRQMIRIACDIAKQTGWKFYVRYHPCQQGNEYDRFINSPWYLGNGGKISVEQYSTMVDFSLVGRSTMLIDLVARGKRAYHYRDERGCGAYSMDECSFCNSQNVIEMEKNLNATELQWNSLREQLLGPDNAKEKYAEFFKALEKLP